MTHLVFNVNDDKDSLGEFILEEDTIYIYLHQIWNEYVNEFHGLSENLFIDRISDCIGHEWIHAAIDECFDETVLEDKKPEDYDDHKVFKYLRVW